MGRQSLPYGNVNQGGQEEGLVHPVMILFLERNFVCFLSGTLSCATVCTEPGSWRPLLGVGIGPPWAWDCWRLAGLGLSLQMIVGY